MMESTPTHQEIACQQVLVDDASVFSIQWSVFPAMIMEGFSPENLLERYLAFIRDCTISIIRPLVLITGVEFRLLGTNWSLINFLPPEAVPDSVTLRICGGLLVQPGQSNRSEFRLGLEPVPGGVRVSLRLSEFCPLLLGGTPPSTFLYWLYRLDTGRHTSPANRAFPGSALPKNDRVLGGSSGREYIRMRRPASVML